MDEVHRTTLACTSTIIAISSILADSRVLDFHVRYSIQSTMEATWLKSSNALTFHIAQRSQILLLLGYAELAEVTCVAWLLPRRHFWSTSHELSSNKDTSHEGYCVRCSGQILEAACLCNSISYDTLSAYNARTTVRLQIPQDFFHCLESQDNKWIPAHNMSGGFLTKDEHITRNTSW